MGKQRVEHPTTYKSRLAADLASVLLVIRRDLLEPFTKAAKQARIDRNSVLTAALSHVAGEKKAFGGAIAEALEHNASTRKSLATKAQRAAQKVSTKAGASANVNAKPKPKSAKKASVKLAAKPAPKKGKQKSAKVTVKPAAKPAKANGKLKPASKTTNKRPSAAPSAKTNAKPASASADAKKRSASQRAAILKAKHAMIPSAANSAEVVMSGPGGEMPQDHAPSVLAGLPIDDAVEGGEL